MRLRTSRHAGEQSVWAKASGDRVKEQLTSLTPPPWQARHPRNQLRWFCVPSYCKGWLRGPWSRQGSLEDLPTQPHEMLYCNASGPPTCRLKTVDRGMLRSPHQTQGEMMRLPTKKITSKCWLLLTFTLRAGSSTKT